MHIPPPPTLPPESIVDCYVRDSGGPRQDASTDQQLAEITAYCQQHGLILRRKYSDVAKSGGSTVARDQFNELIDSTRHEDKPQGILLWNYARFARDLDDAIYYKALLRNRNIIVHSLTDPIPEGQYGRIVEFFIDISNEEKRRQTSADAKRGLRDLVLKHGCVPGTPPVGFKRQPVEIGTRRDGSPHTANRWVPDPELLPRVKRAFEMRASGSTLIQVHNETKLFSAINSYKTFYTNRLFIGILQFGDLVVENYCEPIIDMQTWNAVQERIRTYTQTRTSERHPRRINSPYLLSGLVYCDFCGSPMFGNTATRHDTASRDEAYRCSRARRKRDCTAPRLTRYKLEQAVFYTLKEYILTPESLAAIFEISRTATDHREAHRTERLSTLEAEKKTIAKKIVNITRAIAERGHSTPLLDALTELETRRAAIIAEIAELTAMRLEPIPALTDFEIINYAINIKQTLDHGTPEEIRQIMSSFVYQIRAKKEGKQITGTITYYAPPPPTPEEQNKPPLFESAPAGEKSLPITVRPVGAHTYRQTFSHPIIEKPRL